MKENKLDEKREVADLDAAFNAFIDDKENARGMSLMNEAVRALARTAFLEGAKYSAERVKKIFADTFKSPGSIPFPKL